MDVDGAVCDVYDLYVFNNFSNFHMKNEFLLIKQTIKLIYLSCLPGCVSGGYLFMCLSVCVCVGGDLEPTGVKSGSFTA